MHHFNETETQWTDRGPWAFYFDAVTIENQRKIMEVFFCIQFPVGTLEIYIISWYMYANYASILLTKICYHVGIHSCRYLYKIVALTYYYHVSEV